MSHDHETWFVLGAAGKVATEARGICRLCREEHVRNRQLRYSHHRNVQNNIVDPWFTGLARPPRSGFRLSVVLPVELEVDFVQLFLSVLPNSDPVQKTYFACFARFWIFLYNIFQIFPHVSFYRPSHQYLHLPWPTLTHRFPNLSYLCHINPSS